MPPNHEAISSIGNLAIKICGCHFSFKERIKGSHQVFRKAGIEEKINLQNDGNNAKPYQVKQVRNVILKYKLGGEL